MRFFFQVCGWPSALWRAPVQTMPLLVWYRCDWRDQKQPSLQLCCHFDHMFHAFKRTRSSYYCCVFSTHQASTTVQHTQCPCRFVILLMATKKALYSHKLRDIYMHRKYQDTRYIHTRYTLACGVWGLFSWNMAAGLLAFSSRQFALAYNQSWTFVRFTLFFLPEQA